MLFLQLIGESFLLYFHFFVFNFIIQSTYYLYHQIPTSKQYIDQSSSENESDSLSENESDTESEIEIGTERETENNISEKKKQLINIDFNLKNDFNPYINECSNIIIYQNGERKEFKSIIEFVEHFSLYYIESYIIVENNFKLRYLTNVLKKIFITNYIMLVEILILI